MFVCRSGRRIQKDLQTLFSDKSQKVKGQDFHPPGIQKAKKCTDNSLLQLIIVFVSIS